jgi:2-polyprenyl-3-methyl-5-hydroxy-6-metoxy-1,4-benzoquinol methylase
MDTINKAFWEKTGGDYSRKWESRAKQLLSALELNFIGKHLADARRCLDIGCGNGRIIEFLSKSTAQDSAILGVDIASSMVDVCKEKFRLDSKVKDLAICDVSQEEIPFAEPFDVITCIRVLKYSQNWQAIISKIRDRLKNGGVFIFEMPNNSSITRFAPQSVPTYYSSCRELQTVLTSQGFRDIEMTGFTKLPDVLYDWSNVRVLANSLLRVEHWLNMLLGDRALTRLIFVKCVKA